MVEIIYVLDFLIQNSCIHTLYLIIIIIIIKKIKKKKRKRKTYLSNNQRVLLSHHNEWTYQYVQAVYCVNELVSKIQIYFLFPHMFYSITDSNNNNSFNTDS
jgi:hypothetical protein